MPCKECGVIEERTGKGASCQIYTTLYTKMMQKQPLRHILKISVVFFCSLIILFGGVFTAAFIMSVTQPTDPLGYWLCGNVGLRCPFPKEGKGETLVVIATFYEPLPNKNKLHRRIEDKVQLEKLTSPETTLRVEVAPETLKADASAAKALARHYKASIIVYGEETQEHIAVYLYNADTNQSSNVIMETRRIQPVATTNFPMYSDFILKELPETVTATLQTELRR